MSTGIAREWYTFGEIATEMKVSHGTVRNLFVREPGVLRVSSPGSKRPTYCVSASVYERVKLRLSNPPPTPSPRFWPQRRPRAPAKWRSLFSVSGYPQGPVSMFSSV